MRLETPELDKMAVVRPESQAIGEFIEWLHARGYHLGRDNRHGDCEHYLGSIETLLADYFEIDLGRVETERRAILDALRDRSE